MPAAPITNTTSGTVRGFRQNGVAAFRGIPYAAAPVGPLRFRPPVLPEPWAGVRDAVRFGPMAPQYGPMREEDTLIGPYMTGGRAHEIIEAGIERGEDCLRLNVLTPQASAERARPVLVYLHGCGYNACSPFTPSLADGLVREQDVVLVTVGHRLNLFGFLYFGDLDPRYADGDVGLLDLVRALQWVRDNIAGFGGDPGRVTIFGESGGGWKVLDLLGMPQAQGLFHRAIVESAPWPERIERDTAAAGTTRLLGNAGVTDPAGLPDVPADTLVEAMRTAGPHTFRPVIDGRTLTGRVWTTGAPGTAAGVPLLIGNCRDEMTALTNDETLFEVGRDDVVPVLSARLDLPAHLLEPVIEVYRASRRDASDVLFGIWSDRLFGTAAAAIGRWQSEQAPTYRYHFAYPTPVGRLGAFHTAELPLAMRLVHYPQTERLSRQLATAWAAFARDGDPGHDGMPHWERNRAGCDATMVFGTGTELRYDLHAAELAAVSALPAVTTAQGRR